MRQARTKKVDSTIQRTTGASAPVRTLLLVLVCVVLGLAGGAYWHYRATSRTPTHVGAGNIALSESTKLVLNGLGSPVEVRFYSLLDSASTSEALREYAGRVDQLLSEYEREAGGKIKVTRRNSRSESDMDAASADGLRAFNSDKGEDCFLGLTVAQRGQKETLGQLAPEWEQALESDLTRAILRVTGAQAVAEREATTARADAATVEDVKRAIPEFASISTEEGKQMLREAALKEFKAAASEMQTQMQQAQQRLSQAQTSGSEAEQQAAMQQLQQIQTEQTEKLQAIAARSQAQIQAWEKLKAK